MTRRLLPSGVIVEVDRRAGDFRLALIRPDRADDELIVSEDEAGALMDGLMIEYVQ